MDQSKSYNRPGGYTGYTPGTPNVTVVDLLAQILTELKFHNEPARRRTEVIGHPAVQVFERDKGRCRRCRRRVDPAAGRSDQGAAFLRADEPEGPPYILLCCKCRQWIGQDADRRRDALFSAGSSERVVTPAERVPGHIGYFRLDDKFPDLTRGGRDAEGGLRELGIDDDDVLLEMRGRGVQDDLDADGPVDDDVPALRPDAHDPALVHAPSDDVSGRFQGLGLDADDELKGRAPSPEGLHGQSLPDSSDDTPEPPVAGLTHYSFCTDPRRPFFSRMLCDLACSRSGTFSGTSNWAHVTCHECQDIGAGTVAKLNSMSDAALVSLGAAAPKDSEAVAR